MFRNKYTRMTLAEKRQMYKCGDGYMTLNKIPVWPVLYKKVKPGPVTTRIPLPSYDSNEKDDGASNEGKENQDELRSKSGHKTGQESHPDESGHPKHEDNETNHKPKGRPMDVNNEINYKVSLWNGDITTLEIDAIVRGTDTTLREKLGPHASVHKSAGPTLMKDVQAIKGCETGDSKITSGHKLPAKYIIHTVGPFFGQENPKLLQACYESCLDLILEFNIRTVAFPCVSTGLYGYPNRDAAEVALRTTRKWLQRHAEKVERIIFCTFLSRDFQIYQRLMTTKYFPCECPMAQHKMLTSSQHEENGDEVGADPNERFTHSRGRKGQGHHGSVSFREKSRDRDHHEKTARERDKSRNRDKSRERKHWDREQQRMDWERTRDRERNRERNWDRGRDRDFDREPRDRSRRSEDRRQLGHRGNHSSSISSNGNRNGRLLKSSLSKSMCNLASMSQARDESEEGAKQCSKTDDHLGKRVRYADEDDILGRRPSTRRSKHSKSNAQQQQQQLQPKPVLRPRSAQENYESEAPFAEPAKAASNLDEVISEINTPTTLSTCMNSVETSHRLHLDDKENQQSVAIEIPNTVDTVIQHDTIVAEVPKLDDLMSQINCSATTNTEASLASESVPFVDSCCVDGSIMSTVNSPVPKLDDIMSQINCTTSLDEEIRAADAAAKQQMKMEMALDYANTTSLDKEEDRPVEEKEEGESCIDSYIKEGKQHIEELSSPTDIPMSSRRYKSDSSSSYVRKVSEDSGIDINTTTYVSDYRPIDDLTLSTQCSESKGVSETALDVGSTVTDVDEVDKDSTSVYSTESDAATDYQFPNENKTIDSKFSFNSSTYSKETEITVGNVDCILDTHPGTSVDEPTLYDASEPVYGTDISKYISIDPPSPTMKNISGNSDAIESIEETLSCVDALPVGKDNEFDIDCVDDIDKIVDIPIARSPIDTLDSEIKDGISGSPADDSITELKGIDEIREMSATTTLEAAKEILSDQNSLASEISTSTALSTTSSSISSSYSIYSSPYISSYSSSTSSTDVSSSKSDVTSPRSSYTSSYSTTSDPTSTYGSYSSDSTGSYRSRYSYSSPSSSSSSSSYTDRYSSSTSSSSSSASSSNTSSSISTKLEDRTWERVGATSGVTDRYDSYTSRYQHSDRIRAIMDKYTDRTSY